MKEFRHVTILNALLQDCKQSDRNVAKIAQTSQPTVTRVRQKLEKAGIIKDYFAIPDFKKLGYEFGAITICEVSDPINTIRALAVKHSVIITAPAVSIDSNLILITLHKTIEDYDALLNDVKPHPLKSYLFTTKGLEIKPVQVRERPFVALE